MTAERPSVDLHISGSVARIILSNEGHRNAMTRTMWSELAGHCADLAATPDMRAVVIRGNGEDAFASGADISEFGESRRTADQTAAYHESVQTALDAITAIPCPVIAQIHGYCIGAGTAIALSCDMRYGDERTRYGIPAAKLGIGYNPNWVRNLVQVVGKANAAEILMTARLFDADKALRTGFANDIRPTVELDDYIGKLVETISGNAPLTLSAAKVAIREIVVPEADRDWSAAVTAARVCSDSEDYQHALVAFSEKRKPAFSGR